MEITNNGPETSDTDYEEEDNVSQAREVPLQNAEEQEVASEPRKAKKRKVKVKGANKKERKPKALTSEVWQYFDKVGFVDGIESAKSHYVDSNWKLQSKILAFAHMEPPHTGRELALKVLEMLNDWGIEKKVFSITLDNASANDTMQKFLKEHLEISNSLLLNGEYFHIRCSAHVLNLIVQDGLKTVSDELHKIRQSVGYVKVTESRTLAFFECVKNIGDIDTTIGLRSDCVTRWNSTYIMLQSAINYRRAFYSLSLRDSNFKCCPTSVEWKRAETLCDLLKPFYNITNLISGSSYPTSNLYFGEIWKIECLLRSYLTSEDPLIQNMTTKMKEKFDKYWSDYSVILAFATILDPTKKLKFVRYAYSKLDPLTSEDKSKSVKMMLEKLCAEYVNNEIPSSNSSSSQQVVQPPSGRLASIDELEFEEFENQETTDIGKTELDTYLDELRMPSSACFDILAYWKERSRKSPTLARIACDILSIPITTVASESAFSIELDDVNSNIDKDDEIRGSVQASNTLEYVNID
ncbi:hypothetical protein TSUD_274470 [Trifolium subterraneum]|uniref:HAT C-terminal dimerisation domain-containing protein n=1 Tax=Trifolium subterraneum TaxID=3900 RepID=A0A2Z6NXD5_TRISU|nr:hypothetical protein TSUD_274470 [Trifolium subterraneum]